MWIKELKQYAEPDIVLAIAGNKCDLEDLREISTAGKLNGGKSLIKCSYSGLVSLWEH